MPFGFSAIRVDLNSCFEQYTLTLCNYQIADGMTVEIHTVNLLLETRGGAGRGGASW